MNLSENQGNIDDIAKSDVIIGTDIGDGTTDCPVEPFVPPYMVLNRTVEEIMGSPRRKVLQSTIKEDDEYKKGFDSDGRCGPFLMQ